MYWLLEPRKQETLRKKISALVDELSRITDNPQLDQIFPFVGRKDRRKAAVVAKHLVQKDGLVVEPFAGSGSIVYGAQFAERRVQANEWEPYAARMAGAPYRLPQKKDLEAALKDMTAAVRPQLDELYRTVCDCGHKHVLDSLFFDREPLSYQNVKRHERLGHGGRNITYRGKYKCPKCRKTEKFFDASDAHHLSVLDKRPVSRRFASRLIENSRINLNRDFLIYKKLFPHRSQLALDVLWNGIEDLKCGETTRAFLVDAFLSILPQAKYKDYRAKSQDLHCPPEQLRETNLFYRFIDQVEKRKETLYAFPFAKISNDLSSLPFRCLDYRAFLDSLPENSCDLVFTDPPWQDGACYFERAQLYHPWLNYSLAADPARLHGEMGITNAPSRPDRDETAWWADTAALFNKSGRVLKPGALLALYFRPIPARRWLQNLNKLKLIARQAGYEPLIAIDVASSDPSMRVQQSAAFVFAEDIIFLFLKLTPEQRRVFSGQVDLDQIAYQAAMDMQEKNGGPFDRRAWETAFNARLEAAGEVKFIAAKHQVTISILFARYCDDQGGGKFLPKADTPFSSQIFDVPAAERLFRYLPHVVNELTETNPEFSFESLLLKLSEFVENGTRDLIKDIEKTDIRKVISTYATPMRGGHMFRKKPLPDLPGGLRNVLELDPYDFEAFTAHLFEAQGFKSVRLLGRSGDRGVDVAGIDPDGKETVIQCKRFFNHKVSADAIQRLHSFSATRGAQRRIIVTTSDFTPDAKDEGRLTKSELINGRALETMIAQHLPDYFDGKKK